MELSNEITSLSEIFPNRKYSGFGVILDATRAQKTKNQQEFCTQIKIIDESFNPALELKDQAKKYITLFIYWTQYEYNPFVYKVGDIIRFLNFEFETYNGYLQGKNRKHSSWKLHHGDSQNNEPYFHSVEMKEKTTNQHVQFLQSLRQWSYSFFATYPLTTLDWYSLER